ncbi:MAG: phospho-N-acetylmuramoyl-pentapeptide-transferase [Flavobacteriales bacterium]|nr:MAG: phospho-N-acetylmuramoyl-pentapeptide-transferase [Flavobacteriales bacterium]
MLYYLFEYIESNFQIAGASLFQYLSFRSAITFITALLISTIFGKKIINFLAKKQIGENIRKLDLPDEELKKGTPTMGGLIIIISTIIPILLFSDFNNSYVIILLVSTFWLGLIGFIDDYIKVFKKNKAGLKGAFKIAGQVILGLYIGFNVYFNPDIKIKLSSDSLVQSEQIDNLRSSGNLKTTIPFFKNNELDYEQIFNIKPDNYNWVFYVLIITFIIVSVSNGANLTDGLDGLAAGSSAIIIFTLAIFSWISGNIIFSEYLNILYIPGIGEIVVFIAALLGGIIGFLWYNTYPAQIFMGDTGSLTLGGIIAVIAILVRKELLLPILCGVFLVESLSVIIQVTYFKYTKRKFGNGVRVFLMTPIHHHFQKLGYNESKIVSRFWIICIMLAIISLITLKIR